jgi:hypothetical protein
MVTMTTYTTTDVRNAATALSTEAIQAGVIPANGVLVFHKGNSSNGIAPRFSVTVPGAGERQFEASFLPRFTYKSTAREMVFALDAARLALNAVNNRS